MTAARNDVVAEMPPRPLTVERAYWAALAWVAVSVVGSLALWLHKSYVRTSLIDANKKAKKPQDFSIAGKLDHAVNSSLIYGTVQMVVIGAIIVLGAISLRRGRSWSRWVLLILAVVPVFGTGVLVQLIGGITVHAPADYKVLAVLAGLLALAVVVLLLMPDTLRWFSALRAARSGQPAGAAPARRPGLFGSLMNPARKRVEDARVTRESAAQETSPDDSSAETKPARVTRSEGPTLTDRTTSGARPRSGAKPKSATGTPQNKARRR